MTEIDIPDERGRSLEARVEIGHGRIVLHSRSGGGERARNPDYRRALEIMLTRLGREGARPSVFLDSAPARSRPLEERRLAAPSDLSGSAQDQAGFIIRKSNADGPSHGAWRRLLLTFDPPMPEYALRSILDGSVGNRSNGLPTRALDQVEAQHLHAAVAELRGPSERPNRFTDATGYLLHAPDGGDPLPPKKVFGLALAEALQTHTTPRDFSSGDRIFEIMRRHGFDVRPLHDADPGDERDAAAGVPPPPEEQAWIEGDPRFKLHLTKERSGSLPQDFKRAFQARHGRLFCEGCRRDHLADYGEHAHACFEVHHTVPVADMAAGHRTTADQLLLLCANCHRAAHRRMAVGTMRAGG